MLGAHLRDCGGPTLPQHRHPPPLVRPCGEHVQEAGGPTSFPQASLPLFFPLKPCGEHVQKTAVLIAFLHHHRLFSPFFIGSHVGSMSERLQFLPLPTTTQTLQILKRRIIRPGHTVYLNWILVFLAIELTIAAHGHHSLGFCSLFCQEIMVLGSPPLAALRFPVSDPVSIITSPDHPNLPPAPGFVLVACLDTQSSTFHNLWFMGGMDGGFSKGPSHAWHCLACQIILQRTFGVLC